MVSIGDHQGASLSGEGRQSGHILVVDDDPTTRDMIVDYLNKYHLLAASASDPQEMVRLLAETKPNLVILDLRPGQQDEFDLLHEIRSRSDVPVIITTSHRCDEIDRAIGLELGADDYVIKPFSLRELLARIRAVLRRCEAPAVGSQRESDQALYRFGNWALNRRTRRLTDPKGVSVTLTKGEYAMLNAFLDAPQQVLSRERLLQATRKHEDIFDRSIDVQILRLRRKLESDPGAPRIIRTERGVGYVFVLPVQRAMTAAFGE
jgi:DNA-binding response OmpR family regulator